MKRAALLLLFVLATLAGRARAESEGLGPSVLRAPVTERVAEQGILTPVPVRILLPAGMPAHRVLVHYKLFGLREWTTIELSRSEAGWSGLVPCLEVSTVTGDLVYYIRVHDVDGAVVAYSGSQHEPHRVRIVHPSARPGIAAGKCPDPSDCPAGLPGCPSEPVQRVPCRSDSDCEGGKTCGWDGYCEAVNRPRNWLSVEVEQDLGLVAATGACSVYGQENEGYACTRRTDGAQYLGNPVYTNEPVAPAVGQLRAVIGYERLIFYGSSVGIRVAYALTRQKELDKAAPFFPLLVELRAAHWFGADPFARTGLRPYVFASAGAGMFDLAFTVHVREDPAAASVQGGNALHQDLDGHRRSGDVFVGVGGGLMMAFWSSGGPSLEVAAAQVFPYGASVLIPRLGWRVGF